MNETAEIRKVLIEAIGEEGCGVTCSQADIFHDEEGWKFQLEGFMEPWKLGRTLEKACATVKQLASMGFGLA